MARRYYDTTKRVYDLFNNHPALSQMYSEFGIDLSGIKRVAEFLILNHDLIETYDLQDIYNISTPSTYEPDQIDPVKGTVATVDDLPTANLSQYDIYYITELETYYVWSGTNWSEDQNAIELSDQDYLSQLYQERGYKVWEPDSGYFIAMEQTDNSIAWEKIESTTADHIIIRKSNLPSSPLPGEIYKVKGEDLIDIIASLYGLVDMGMTPPWSNYISPKQTNLQELLNMTVYLYRYGVTDNFYENNIWQFIPEFDRDAMKEQPKIKLFMESIGRKLDQLEDELIRLQDVYDIDKTPSELLNHLGHMLGYEKEDFSLSDVSFRELLKNIIEIYKIKGTNYSFSFFFKFLGFNVNLKEFYFNKDVKNPEAFPGMDVDNVEYYLTTTDPRLETYWGNPAPYLEQIRSLDDWDLEYNLLLEAGCTNPVDYMLGNEAHSADGTTWHSNPWTYFKSNLIEYELNPFFDKISLTSSDNKTIQKYIKFLSPTYLFTWINVNLAPWIENINIYDNIEESITAQINKVFGDVEDGEFKDYEEVEDYLQVWDDKENKLISYRKADEMQMSIVNNLNLGGDDQVGAQLQHDGVYIRQPGHPSHITGVYHNGSTHLSFDNLGIMIKETNNLDYDYSFPTLADLPYDIDNVDRIAYVEETGLYYIYEDPSPTWELSDESPTLTDKYTVTTYDQLTNKIETSLVDRDIWYVSNLSAYYQYSATTVDWSVVTFTEVVDWYKQNYYVETGNDLNALSVSNGEIYYVVDTDTFYSYYTMTASWSIVLDITITSNSFEQTLNIFQDSIITTYYNDLLLKLPAERDMIYRISSTNQYYKFINEEPYWNQAYETDDRYGKWLDYSYRPYPSYPISVKPAPGIELSVNTINFSWDNVYAQQGYWVQASKAVDFSDLIFEKFIYNNENYIEDILLENDNYYWRIRTKNNLDTNVWPIDKIDEIELYNENIKSYFAFDGNKYIVRNDLTGYELDELNQIFVATGNKYSWGAWSSIYRFDINGLPFPHNNQVIDSMYYQYISVVRDSITDSVIGASINIQWPTSTNIEMYEMVLAFDESFTQLIAVEKTQNNYFDMELSNGDYYWKYRSKKYNKDWSSYSDTLTFRLNI